MVSEVGALEDKAPATMDDPHRRQYDQVIQELKSQTVQLQKVTAAAAVPAGADSPLVQELKKVRQQLRKVEREEKSPHFVNQGAFIEELKRVKSQLKEVTVNAHKMQLVVSQEPRDQGEKEASSLQPQLTVSPAAKAYMESHPGDVLPAQLGDPKVLEGQLVPYESGTRSATQDPTQGSAEGPAEQSTAGKVIKWRKVRTIFKKASAAKAFTDSLQRHRRPIVTEPGEGPLQLEGGEPVGTDGPRIEELPDDYEPSSDEKTTRGRTGPLALPAPAPRLAIMPPPAPALSPEVGPGEETQSHTTEEKGSPSKNCAKVQSIEEGLAWVLHGQKEEPKTQTLEWKKSCAKALYGELNPRGGFTQLAGDLLSVSFAMREKIELFLKQTLEGPAPDAPLVKVIEDFIQGNALEDKEEAENMEAGQKPKISAEELARQKHYLRSAPLPQERRVGADIRGVALKDLKRPLRHVTTQEHHASLDHRDYSDARGIRPIDLEEGRARLCEAKSLKELLEAVYADPEFMKACIQKGRRALSQKQGKIYEDYRRYSGHVQENIHKYLEALAHHESAQFYHTLVLNIIEGKVKPKEAKKEEVREDATPDVDCSDGLLEALEVFHRGKGSQKTQCAALLTEVIDARSLKDVLVSPRIYYQYKALPENIQKAILIFIKQLSHPGIFTDEQREGPYQALRSEVVPFLEEYNNDRCAYGLVHALEEVRGASSTQRARCLQALKEAISDDPVRADIPDEMVGFLNKEYYALPPALQGKVDHFLTLSESERQREAHTLIENVEAQIIKAEKAFVWPVHRKAHVLEEEAYQEELVHRHIQKMHDCAASLPKFLGTLETTWDETQRHTCQGHAQEAIKDTYANLLQEQYRMLSPSVQAQVDYILQMPGMNRKKVDELKGRIEKILTRAHAYQDKVPAHCPNTLQGFLEAITIPGHMPSRACLDYVETLIEDHEVANPYYEVFDRLTSSVKGALREYLDALKGQEDAQPALDRFIEAARASMTH